MDYQPAQRLACELLAYPQQAKRSCLFMLDHISYICIFPQLISKTISNNFYRIQ